MYNHSRIFTCQVCHTPTPGFYPGPGVYYTDIHVVGNPGEKTRPGVHTKQATIPDNTVLTDSPSNTTSAGINGKRHKAKPLMSVTRVNTSGMHGKNV